MVEHEFRGLFDDPHVAVGLAKACPLKFGKTVEPTYPRCSDGFVVGVDDDMRRLEIIAVECSSRGEARSLP